MFNRQEDKYHIFLDHIYRTYGRFMTSIARSYTADTRACEDICHNTFLSLIRSKELLATLPVPKLRAYIVLATRHACIDYLRKERRIELAEIPDDILYTLLSASEGMQMMTESPFNAVDFYSVIRLLPAEDQTLLIGHYIVGLDLRELAKVIDCSDSTARVKLHRARKHALDMFASLDLHMEDFML